MLVIFAILFLLACVLVPNFASLINMRGLGLAVSMSGMVACGMLFCLASGEFDMSVGSVVACSGVACAVGINATESIPLGILAGLSVGLVFGLINGIVVAKFKINALITTLATMQMARGWATSSPTARRWASWRRASSSLAPPCSASRRPSG
jgi:L-arabinose transport system permease protein